MRIHKSMNKEINIAAGEGNPRSFVFREQSALVEVRFQECFSLRRELIWLIKLENILYTRKKTKKVQV